ncbi:zonular occludens toxin domain-containing protein [Acinetobacter seifertii]|uniref:zonular occludens toxin domain-containing protein n=1 Tax=Acinetobacter seifertii TaxID=1530123 RepID=UPI000C1ED91B|nr:zonular occludens toxin domain-containing protein [Acinetobacter seifertii]PJF05139.1 zonula occludens toxin [Acinetobacter seifertii]PJG69291.1 zonula occludens toxin [Acinetobacter seifertii]
MLHLITGTPGAGKTLYAVFLIDNYEKANKRALDFNVVALKQNKEAIENNSLKDYFASYTYFSKITKEYETLYFEPDYFDYLEKKERKETIFLDIQFYNGILANIKNDLNLELKQLKSVRHIYSNIDGLKVDFVRPMQVDWRKCPDGSIVFYDEIQLIDVYSNDNKRDDEGIVKSLTVHRHRAFDIYGITQFPRLVHPGFRDVVGLHYHLHRGWGAPSATVYVWANCREKPNSLGNKFTAERDFRFNYPKRLYEIYESATANTVKLRIPLKLFAILIIPIVGVFMFGNMIFGHGPNFFTRIFGGSEPEKTVKQTNQTQPSASTSKETTSQDPVALVPEQDCRKAVNVEKPECVKYFNDLTNSNASVTQRGYQVSYNPDKPFDNGEIQENLHYDVTAKPVFSGCTKMNGKYQAYTQQGTKLDVSKSDCERLIKNNDRPFNYFVQPRNESMNTEILEKDSVEPTQPRQQPIQYAENYVQRGLERDPNWDL